MDVDRIAYPFVCVGSFIWHDKREAELSEPFNTPRWQQPIFYINKK